MNDQNGPQNPMARQTSIVIHEMPDEVLVYDLDTNKAHCLNQSAAFIWASCDGKNSILDIVQQFESNGGGQVTEDFVWLAVDQLNEKGLLENNVALRFNGASRRKIIKTIGLASIVALPIIASLVAPQRSFGTISNCVCTSNFQCSQPSNSGCPSTTNCNNLGLCAPNTSQSQKKT